MIIPGLFASSFTIKNSVVVSFSGRYLPPHSHSSCEESNTSFPCLIIFLDSSMLVTFFLNCTLIVSISILIEIGFLSNKIESRRLLRDTYRQKIAEGIALGVKSYILK